MGAQDRQGQGAHDQEGEHGDEHQVDRLGDEPVEQLFHLGLHQDHQDDGDDSARIVHQAEGDQLKEADRLPRAVHRDPGGVHHDAGHRGGQDGVALELLGFAEGDHHRQEVKDRVCKKVEDGVGLGGRVDGVEHHQQGHQRLEHAGAGQGRDDGLEGAGHKEECYVPHPIVGAINANPPQGVVLLDEKK